MSQAHDPPEIPAEYDPRTAPSKEKAVFIGQQVSGTSIIVGDEEEEEWISSNNMVPLELEKYR